MTLNEFSKQVCSDLPQGSTCIYGDAGTGYLNVLVPIEGKILLVGTFLYDIFKHHFLYDELWNSLQTEFKKEMSKCYRAQLVGVCEYIPSIHNDGHRIKLHKSKATFEIYMRSIS